MKIWNGYGSEHSANLVMIGHFKNAGDAAKTMEVIERLTEQVRTDEDAGLINIGGGTNRYGDAMLHLLESVKVHSVGPAELEQFIYDVRIKVKDNDIVLTTEETEVSAFLKVLIDHGARVEVYSAHDYPDTDQGRGK